MKTPNHTVRYVAKQGYQLNLMRGIRTGKVCGFDYLVWNDLGVMKVKVYGVVNKDGSRTDVNITVPKAWRELI